jgi:AAA domain-containing protein
VNSDAAMPEERRAELGNRFGRSRIFTAAELMARELPPVRWVVPGILPEGVTLLAGKPKLGKSWLALGLGVAVASGGIALGTRPVESGDVLYLALEDNPRRLQGRLGKMLAGNNAPDGLHITTDWPRMDEGGADLLDDWLGARPDGRLVMVDILKRVRPRASANRSVYDTDYEALQGLQSLAAEHGAPSSWSTTPASSRPWTRWTRYPASPASRAARTASSSSSATEATRTPTCTSRAAR